MTKKTEKRRILKRVSRPVDERRMTGDQGVLGSGKKLRQSVELLFGTREDAPSDCLADNTLRDEVSLTFLLSTKKSFFQIEIELNFKFLTLQGCGSRSSIFDCWHGSWQESGWCIWCGVGLLQLGKKSQTHPWRRERVYPQSRCRIQSRWHRSRQDSGGQAPTRPEFCQLAQRNLARWTWSLPHPKQVPSGSRSPAPGSPHHREWCPGHGERVSGKSICKIAPFTVTNRCFVAVFVELAAVQRPARLEMVVDVETDDSDKEDVADNLQLIRWRQSCYFVFDYVFKSLEGDNWPRWFGWLPERYSADASEPVPLWEQRELAQEPCLRLVTAGRLFRCDALVFKTSPRKSFCE